MLKAFGAVAFACVLGAVPVIAGAQSSTNFNIAAGLSLATSDFGNRNDAGYNLTAGIGMRQRGSPLGFRAEGTYNEFNQTGIGGSSHAGGVTINATYDLMPATAQRSASLYGIGGIGYYSTLEPYFDGDQAQSNIGWNIGAGFRFPLSGFSVYVEARYHSVNQVDMTFVPITFGLVF